MPKTAAISHPACGALSEETALYLTSADGAKLLEDAAVLPGDASQRLMTLRKRGVPPEIAPAALALIDARRRAALRFPEAERLFFTADALAQATSPLLARYHAERLRASGFASVVDLGCGIGMDAAALAGAGLRVLAIERDPARLLFARANVRILGVEDRVDLRRGDVTDLDWSADGAYWDPSRRTTADASGPARRVSRHGDLYEPPLSFLAHLRERVRGGCVKLSPALPDDTLSDLNGSVEFLSESRECKEACLWFGDAHGGARDAPFAALLLPDQLALPRRDRDAAVGADPPVGAIGAYLFDPDPAVIRARALGPLADGIGARRIGAADAYLTGDTLPPASLAAAVSTYRITESLPYRPGPVGALLRARGVGRLVVKKRHFPLEPDALTIALQWKRSEHGDEATLVLIRTASAPRPTFWAVFCHPVPMPPRSPIRSI
jgi:SAM-dependent methyltransferase